MKGVLFKTRFEKMTVGPAQPATELETGLTLAKLTALLRRYDEAADRLKQLSIAHKDSYEIEEGLAHLYWRKGELDNAKQHFARATGLGSPVWKTWWDYSRLLEATSEHGAPLEVALRKTLELKADLTEAQFMLGNELYRQRKWAQAFTTLRDIKNVEPERAPGLFLILAYSAMNMDRKDDAKRFALDAKKWATKDSDRQGAEQLLKYLEQAGQVTFVERPAPAQNERPAADGVAPALQRREVPESAVSETRAPEPQYLTVKGRLKRLECLGDVARMHVEADRKTLTLMIRKPDQITIRSGGGKSVDLSCGTQDAPVTVDYLPKVDAERKSVGDVYAIEFTR